MKKSNIVKVTVSTSTVSTSTVIVVYKSGTTRTTSLENISKNALEFITGNLNTIVKSDSERTTTTFYADENMLNDKITIIKEMIIRKARTSKVNVTYYFKGEKFTIDTTDFKICADYLYYSLGLNSACKVNITSMDYRALVNLRQEVIKNFYGL